MATLRILIVEDDGLIAALLEELLGQMGHDICGIETTQEGATLAAARARPDLVLLDVGLAEGDGQAAVAAITLDRDVPCIFMTGALLKPESLAPGAVVLRKPFSEPMLAKAIDDALRQRRL